MNLTPPTGIIDPIKAAENATLIFPVSDTGGTVDPATGNYVPNSTTVTIGAKVNPGGDNTEVQPGINQDIFSITGWLTAPPPTTIYHGMTVDATVQGVKGVIEFLSPIQQEYVRAAIANGVWCFKFNGKFRRES